VGMEATFSVVKSAQFVVIFNLTMYGKFYHIKRWHLGERGELSLSIASPQSSMQNVKKIIRLDVLDLFEVRLYELF